MGQFATRVRRGLGVTARLRGGLEAVPTWLPDRFEAVAELLASRRDASVACGVVGRELARDGADLGEALHGLRLAYEHSRGAEPSIADVEALSIAWAEETLGYLHQLSCEDPLTGLASLAHLRGRLTEIYRGADRAGAQVSEHHALVVVDLAGTRELRGAGRFDAALRMVRIAETVRTVFPGEEVIARVGRSRLVVLVAREPTTPRRARLLRDLLGYEVSGSGPSVWQESLPSTSQGVAWLLDELTRGGERAD